tara:strand:+ start:614 stop:1069 length:456 start_codon:yes stop_codon:yes gene_type:complete
MYQSQNFRSIISVNLKDCNDIDESILNQLRLLEGSCISAGFVKHESIKLISRSIGSTNAMNASGDIYFNVIFSGDVYNPVVGQKVKCKVDKINKLGILAYGEKLPVCVLIARQHHENMFRKCTENEMIECEVVGKRFKLKDTEIQVIGKFI